MEGCESADEVSGDDGPSDVEVGVSAEPVDGDETEEDAAVDPSSPDPPQLATRVREAARATMDEGFIA